MSERGSRSSTRHCDWGPNGAGKTTIAREVLHHMLGVCEFVNADTLAAGLSGFQPERAAFAAGRVMLHRLRELALARPRTSFAFESTLASRTFAPWLSGLVDDGFHLDPIFVWLRSPAIAERRVKARVRKGGHHIPVEVIHRRYARSASNMWMLYRPIVERSGGTWQILDNSSASIRRVAQFDHRSETPIIYYANAFNQLKQVAQAQADSLRDSP